MSKRGEMWSMVGTIAAVLVILSLWIFARISYEWDIQHWAQERGYTVVSIERIGPFDNDSPFWRSKGDDLCRVQLKSQAGETTAFFRRGFLGRLDHEWKSD